MQAASYRAGDIQKMSEARNPYGDGTASIKIRKILEDIDA